MEKIKEKINSKKVKILIPVSTLAMTVPAFASEGAVNQQLVSAMTDVASEITATLGQIAPIALSVAVFGMVFKYGLRFFKSLSK